MGAVLNDKLRVPKVYFMLNFYLDVREPPSDGYAINLGVLWVVFIMSSESVWLFKLCLAVIGKTVPLLGTLPVGG